MQHIHMCCMQCPDSKSDFCFCFVTEKTSEEFSKSDIQAWRSTIIEEVEESSQVQEISF